MHRQGGVVVAAHPFRWGQRFDEVLRKERPELDGLELIQRIRARPTPGYVYIILLTARSQKEDVVVGMEAGANDFVAKPFDREELRVRVRAGGRRRADARPPCAG